MFFKTRKNKKTKSFKNDIFYCQEQESYEKQLLKKFIDIVGQINMTPNDRKTALILYMLKDNYDKGNIYRLFLEIIKEEGFFDTLKEKIDIINKKGS